MKRFITEEKKDIRNILGRFKRRDFSGTGGQVIKNSGYQLAQNLVFKGGSLLFTILLARILLPDLMGLYSLSLATIVLFASFSDLGIGAALMTYCANLLGKNNSEKAKGYIKVLLKWKLRLSLLSSGILLSSAYFMAEVYYSKPIVYALLVGGIYIPIVSLLGFIEGIFKASDSFKGPLNAEIIFQISRLILVPLAIFYYLGGKGGLRGIIPIILLAITIAYFLSFIFLVLSARKRLNFLNGSSKSLDGNEIKALKKFIYPLSATALAGMFFGYIDTLMLGHFVSSKFIAYYISAFSLVSGATAIVGFAAIALMPIFAKKSGKALESIFKKTISLTAIISLVTAILIFLSSTYIIKFTYGREYLAAALILKWFAPLILFLPILGIYVSYFVIKKKTTSLATLILISTILNIFLNWVGISYGLEHYGEIGGIFGAVLATISSKIIYLSGLIYFRKK